jgi:hypothetical protein
MVKPFPSKTHIGNHMLHPERSHLKDGHDHHGQLQPLAMRVLPITSHYRRSENANVGAGALIPRTKGRAMAQSAAIPQKACMPNQPKR